MKIGIFEQEHCPAPCVWVQLASAGCWREGESIADCLGSGEESIETLPAKDPA